jgi:cytochrome c oxidase subunit 4
MSQHIIPPRTYLGIFLALVVLTILTVVVSRLPLGPAWHLWLGLAIAVTKATLVILFFMHVYYSSRLTWVVALSGVVFLAILLILTMNDYFTRPPLPQNYPGENPLAHPDHE